jgi:transposase
MSSSSLTALREDARMNKPGPRAGGPTSRRSFTSAQKLDHIAAYEAAMQKGKVAHICGPTGCTRR